MLEDYIRNGGHTIILLQCLLFLQQVHYLILGPIGKLWPRKAVSENGSKDSIEVSSSDENAVKKKAISSELLVIDR